MRTFPVAVWVSILVLFSITLNGETRAIPVILPPTPPCGSLSGTVIDGMETIGGVGWRAEKGAGAISAALTNVSGFSGPAIQLNYDLGIKPPDFDPDTDPHPYAQFVRDFNLPLNLSAGDHLRFLYQGTSPNTIEIGLIAPNGDIYFASSWNEATHVGWWTYATWDFKDFRKDGQPFPDFSQVKTIFISVVATTKESAFGTGSFIIDQLQIAQLASRNVPSNFESVTIPQSTLDSAAAWIAARQQLSGLLKSWQEEIPRFSWLYDQALALIVLSRIPDNLDEARKLVDRLHSLQNADGSWYFGYYYATDSNNFATPPIDNKKDIGPIAWYIYALMRYYFHETDSAKRAIAYQDARQGAAWLATQQKSNGSLSDTITEWNLDAWWAFQVTGYQTQANRLRDYLLNQAWDNQMGRFKSGTERYQIFLDNQTWGAAFLRAVGRQTDARRALSYARQTLATTSSDGSICGFDGAGPFAPWNEGSLQYIDQGGENSSPYYLSQIIGQIAPDGGLQNSPEPVNPSNPSQPHFNAYIVWLSRWHGIAPTAWLYFAGTDEPFSLTPPAMPGAAPVRNFYLLSSPILTWNRVTWAMEYLIEADSSPLFTVPLDFSATVPASSLSVTTSTLPDGTYYWRVRAKNGSILGSWSAVDSFVIDVP